MWLQMVMSRCFLYSTVVLFLASCRGQEQNLLDFNPPVFPKTEQKVVSPLFNNFLFKPNGTIEDMGDFMVIKHFYENYYLHLFEKETGAYIKSFGSYGRGPGELLTPPILRSNEDKSKLYAFQCGNGMRDYWTYRIEDIVHERLTLPVREEKITFQPMEGERNPGSAINFLAWQDKRLFERRRLHRFEVYDTIGNVLCLYDKYPTVRLNKVSDTTAFHDSYLSAAIALKPDMSRFVIASNIGCILEIFTVDTSGKIEKETEKRFYPPVFTVNKNLMPDYYISGQTILGIDVLSVTDDFIYAKYFGKKYISGEPESYQTNTIAVFDWYGNPIRCYILDWAIECIFVDAKRNRCYLEGINAEDEILLGYFDL